MKPEDAPPSSRRSETLAIGNSFRYRSSSPKSAKEKLYHHKIIFSNKFAIVCRNELIWYNLVEANNLVTARYQILSGFVHICSPLSKYPSCLMIIINLLFDEMTIIVTQKNLVWIFNTNCKNRFSCLLKI